MAMWADSSLLMCTFVFRVLDVGYWVWVPHPLLQPVLLADVHRTHKIFDFVVSAGWVNGVDDEAAGQGQGGSAGTRHSGPGSSAYPDGSA